MCFNVYLYLLYLPAEYFNCILFEMGLGSVVDVELASEAESCGFDPRLDARFLPQHVDPSINWVVTWLYSLGQKKICVVQVTVPKKKGR